MKSSTLEYRVLKPIGKTCHEVCKEGTVLSRSHKCCPYATLCNKVSHFIHKEGDGWGKEDMA